MRMTHNGTNRHDAKIDAGRRLADLLRAQILGGLYMTDDALPSENQLMSEFDTGRNVVRSALALLKLDGYVVRLQGQGTFVVSRRTVHDLDQAGGIASDYPGGGIRVFTRFRSVTSCPASGVVATKLGLDVADGLIVAEYITFVDRQPYAIATSYLPRSLVGWAFSRDLEGDWSGDWFEVLHSLGLRTGRMSVQLEAVAADDGVAELLRVQSATPLMRFERLLYDQENRPIDYGFSRCRADRLVLRTDHTDPTRERLTALDIR